MRRSIPFYLAILGLVHFYVGWRLLPDLPIGLGTQIGGALLLAASFASAPLGFAARKMASREWGDRLAAVCLFLVGFFSSLFVFTLLRDVALLFVVLWPGALPLERIITISATAVVTLATLATLVGLLNARRRARSRECRSAAAESCPRHCTASPSRRSATCMSARPSSADMSMRSWTQ